MQISKNLQTERETPFGEKQLTLQRKTTHSTGRNSTLTTQQQLETDTL